MTGGFLQDDRVAIFHCETLLRDRFDFCSLFYRSADSVTCIVGDTSEGKSQTARSTVSVKIEIRCELVTGAKIQPSDSGPEIRKALSHLLTATFVSSDRTHSASFPAQNRISVANGANR